jgi:hypothetical protein
MKLKATSLFLGLCLAILAVAASPAHARSTAAFGAFHAQSATVLTEDQYLCLTEDNGAVVNNCAEPVNLFFDVQIDKAGEKTITLQDYWKSAGKFRSFQCVSYAYTGTMSSSTMGTTITFTETTQTLSTNDDVAPGDTVTVICWQVPPGEGVASVKWNQ